MLDVNSGVEVSRKERKKDKKINFRCAKWDSYFFILIPLFPPLRVRLRWASDFGVAIDSIPIGKCFFKRDIFP